MFIYIDDDGPFPAEEKVPCACSEADGYTQIHVVCHEDEHEEVTYNDLDDV